MIIQFTVPTIPIAQPRQRHRIVASAGRTFVSNYTPTKHPANAFKAAVQWAASRAHKGPPLEGPLSGEILFIMPRPKAMMWKKRLMPREAHAGKPDIDNIYKAFVDALEGLLFRNDSQLFDMRLVKFIAAGDEQPHVESWFETLLEVQ